MLAGEVTFTVCKDPFFRVVCTMV